MSAVALESLVTARAIEKRFGTGGASAYALRGADLEIPAGGITMLVGPSGCGKTTLISIIAGLLDRSAGELSVLGTDPATLSPAAGARFRRENLGFIFQQYNLVPTLTAAENAAVPLLARGVSMGAALRQASALLDELGLVGRGGDYSRSLSGGQQQRVAIARALIHQPRLILCDEPTAALDAQTGHAVMELLRAAADTAGRAVIVVTHDPRIYDFADRLIHMEDGVVARIEER